VDRNDIRQDRQEDFSAGEHEANGLPEVSDWMFWKVRPPSKRKKEVVASLPKKKKKCTRRVVTFTGSRSGRPDLRREQRERMDRNHRRKNRTMEDLRQQRLRERRNGDTPLGYSGLITLTREQCDRMAKCRNRRRGRC
jgi:hypothetical protein